MSFPEFENPDDFDELANWVAKRLDDPDFVESINRTIIINSVVDGQRLYSKDEIDDAEEERQAVLAENFKFAEDNICYILGVGLRQATQDFKNSGSFRLEGEMVSDLVDSYLYEAAKQGWNTDNLRIASEAVVTGAISLMFNKPFQSYQTDITIMGQGLQADTYFMDIQFRPIPKNVQKG